MKRTTRILTLLVVFGLCLSLCGCMKLDELRSYRTSMKADGSIQRSDGTEYKRLPECEEFCPDFGDAEWIYIVEDDLPLLLTTWADPITKSEDGRFLRSDMDANGKPEYYCRTDLYDSVFARIQSGFVPEVYGYEYYDRELDAYQICQLTPDQAAAVEQVYTTQEPEKLPTAARLQYDHRINLCLYSADYLFCRDTLDICLVEGEYFLVGDDNTLYTVPAELFSVFSEIMAKKVGGNPISHVDG